jgi:translation initiation factor 2B subunit (eIF-2B alpha/beta/delta family)
MRRAENELVAERDRRISLDAELKLLRDEIHQRNSSVADYADQVAKLQNGQVEAQTKAEHIEAQLRQQLREKDEGILVLDKEIDRLRQEV